MDANLKIKNRRIELGLTMLQVAEMVGVSEATISRWESGDIANMKRDKIKKLANALKVSFSYIMDDETDDLNQIGIPYNPIVHKIPVLGYISAGLPIYADEHIIDYTYTDKNGGGEYFALRVKGDSMNATQINDGNTVIVRVQPIVENGEIAVVRVNNDEATIKRFKQDGEEVQLIPQSYNPKHIIQTYNLKKDKIDIIGKVVECKIEF